MKAGAAQRPIAARAPRRAATARASQAVARALPELLLALAAGSVLLVIGSLLVPGELRWSHLPEIWQRQPLLWLVLALPVLFWGGRLLYARQRLQAGEQARRVLRHGPRRTVADPLAPLPTPRRIAIAGLTGILDRDTFVAEAHALLAQGPHHGERALLLFDTHQYALLEQGEESQARTFVQQLANRLRQFDGAHSRLAHLGRDRFVLLVDDAGHGLQVQDLAGRILAAFEEPLTVFEQVVAVRPSVGISLFPQHGRTLPELLERAETARYAATVDGRGSALFRSSLDSGRECRARLLTELDHTLREDRLVDDYARQQAQRTDSSSRLRLVPCWPRGDSGRLQESAFINLPARVAELHALSHWLLNRALGRLACWRVSGRAEIVVVRLPDDAIARLPLAAMVQRLLTVHRLSAPLLTLEIGARGLATGGGPALDQLQQLRSMRVGLCLADIGDSLASPAAALQYPFTEIRTLPSLLSRALKDPAAMRTLQALMTLARELKLDCTLAGVVNADCLQLARTLRADRLEGPAVAPLLTLADNDVRFQRPS